MCKAKFKKLFTRSKNEIKKYKDARSFYSDIRSIESGIRMYVPEKSRKYYLDKVEKVMKTARFQVPRKPDFKYYPETRYEPAESYTTCPHCKEELDPELEEGWCPCCGQELDWSVDEEY